MDIVVKISLSSKDENSIGEDMDWGQKVPPTKKAKVNRKASPPSFSCLSLRPTSSPTVAFSLCIFYARPLPLYPPLLSRLSPTAPHSSFPFCSPRFRHFSLPHQLPLLRSTSAAVATAGSRHYLGGGSGSGEGREGAGDGGATRGASSSPSHASETDRPTKHATFAHSLGMSSSPSPGSACKGGGGTRSRHEPTDRAIHSGGREGAL